MDSSEDHVKQILRVHQRAPITLGQSLHIERTGILAHSLVLMSLEARPSGPWEPLDPAATSSAILHEPRQCQVDEPSRVLWIGRLPTDIAWHSQISGADTAVALKSEMGLFM
jgi:hypothetical protein